MNASSTVGGTVFEVTDDWFEDATLRLDEALRPSRLVVRSKIDYWRVPVTEEVPETYRCKEYERRVPGTGYRG